jgi:hypothetical protein
MKTCSARTVTRAVTDTVLSVTISIRITYDT